MADKGPPLNPEITSYFRAIAKSLEEVPDDEKAMLVQNVHSEIVGKEYRLSVNKNCSQILESILQLSPASYLRSFLSRIIDLSYELSFDRNGSHVLQAIFKRMPPILIKEYEDGTVDEVEEEEDGTQTLSMTHVFINLCKQLKEGGWLDLIYDTFGSHIVRDIVAISGGWLVLPSKEAKDDKSNDEGDGKEKVVKKRATSESQQLEFQHLGPISHIIPSILQEILRQPSSDLGTMQLNASGSPVAQLLLEALSKRPTSFADMESFIARLLLWKQAADGSFSSCPESIAHVKALLTSPVGSHMLEKIIACATPAQIVMLYQTHFRENCVELCLDARANFCMQHLLQRISTVADITEILTALEEHFQELFRKRRAGVVRWLVDACLRLKTGHAVVVKALLKAVGINNPKWDKTFVSKFFVFGGGEDNSTISPMNCAILESLMEFPFELMGRIIDSFLAIDTTELVLYACDPTASRVIEAFMSSSTFNSHVKHKLIDCYASSFVSLALNQYGSFVIEKLFMHANKTRRIAIASELAGAEERLGRAKAGRMLLTKFKIPMFKRAQYLWEEQMKVNQKTTALFAELTGDVATPQATKPQTQQAAKKKKGPQAQPTQEAQEEGEEEDEEGKEGGKGGKGGKGEGKEEGGEAKVEEKANNKKRKPEPDAQADKALKLTNQKKKLKSLAGALVGGLTGERNNNNNNNNNNNSNSTSNNKKNSNKKNNKNNSNNTQPTPTSNKKQKKTAAAPSNQTNSQQPAPGALSRAEKRAARRQEHFKKKQASAASS